VRKEANERGSLTISSNNSIIRFSHYALARHKCSQTGEKIFRQFEYHWNLELVYRYSLAFHIFGVLGVLLTMQVSCAVGTDRAAPAPLPTPPRAGLPFFAWLLAKRCSRTHNDHGDDQLWYVNEYMQSRLFPQVQYSSTCPNSVGNKKTRH